MTFLNPLAFFMLIIIFWIFKDLLHINKDKKSTAFAQEQLLQRSQTKMIFISLVFAVIALSRPALNNEINKEHFNANEYIIALDASYSMMMQDIQPSRYLFAEKTIIKLLQADSKNRFSIFVFTTNPLLISPPTTDHQISISALQSFSPEFVLTKGTSLDTLLQQIAKLELNHKTLLLFTDGGEEHQLTHLLKIVKSNAITLNIVAIASSKGALIRKNNRAIKDAQSHLVISRINPILKNLAQQSGGFYMEINSVSDKLSQEILKNLQKQNLQTKELNLKLVSYKELYCFPLFIAFFILLFALTKFQKSLAFLVLLVIFFPPTTLKASLFDFHYKKIAKEAYAQQEYEKSIKYLQKISPTQSSLVAIANAYYKSKKYKDALRFYSQVQSKNPHIKSILYYNMANTAFALHKYKRAKSYYLKSLALEYSKEAEENLFLIYKYHLQSKTNVADMLPHVDDKKVSTLTKKSEAKKNNQKQKSSSSQQKVSQGTQGGAGNKMKQKQNKNTTSMQEEKNKYKMGYNAYELINKGYINEKQPW
jgi:Ca-activated chloride channel family protein